MSSVELNTKSHEQIREELRLLQSKRVPTQRTQEAIVSDLEDNAARRTPARSFTEPKQQYNDLWGPTQGALQQDQRQANRLTAIERMMDNEKQRRQGNFFGSSGKFMSGVFDKLLRGEYATASAAMAIQRGDFWIFNDMWRGFSGKNPVLWDDFFHEYGFAREKLPFKVLGLQMTVGNGLGLLAGFVADPFTYLGLGTVTKSGRIAKILAEAPDHIKRLKIDDLAKMEDEVGAMARKLIKKKGKDEAQTIIEWGPNLREQIKRGQRRIFGLEHPYRRPEVKLIKDMRITEHFFQADRAAQANAFAKIVGHTPVAAPAAAAGAAAGAIAAEPGQGLEGAVVAGLLGASTGASPVRFGEGLKLGTKGGGIVTTAVGGATGGLGAFQEGDEVGLGILFGGAAGFGLSALGPRAAKLFDPKLGILVANIPVLKLPAFRPMGSIDQSISPKFGPVEQWRRKGSENVVAMFGEMGGWIERNKFTGPVVDKFGQTFHKYYRPMGADPNVHRPLVESIKDVMLEKDALVSQNLAHVRDIFSMGDEELKNRGILLTRRLSDSNPYSKFIRAVFDRSHEMPEELRTQIFRMIDSSGRSLDLDSGSIVLDVLYNKWVGEDMIQAVRLEAASIEASVKQLKSGIKALDDDIRTVKEDLVRIANGEPAHRWAVKDLAEADARGQLLNDLDTLVARKKDRREMIARIQDEPIATPKDPADPSSVMSEERLESGNVRRVLLPEDGSAPKIKSADENIDALQEERLQVEKRIEEAEQGLQDTVESSQGARPGAGAEQVQLRQQELEGEIFQQRTRLSEIDQELIERDFAIRTGESASQKIEKFDTRTDEMIRSHPGSGGSAIESIGRAKNEHLTTKALLRRVEDLQDEARMSTFADDAQNLVAETVGDWIKRKSQGMKPEERRKFSASMLQESSFSQRAGKAAEETEKFISEASKELDDLRLISKKVEKEGLKALDHTSLISAVSGKLRTFRPKLSGVERRGGEGLNMLIARFINDERAAIIGAVESQMGPEVAARMALDFGVRDEVISAEVVLRKRRLAVEEGHMELLPTQAQQVAKLIGIEEDTLARIAQSSSRDQFQGFLDGAYNGLEVPDEIANIPVEHLQAAAIRGRIAKGVFGEQGVVLSDLGHTEESVRAVVLPKIHDVLKQFSKVSKANPEDIDFRVISHMDGSNQPGDPVVGVMIYNGPADINEMKYMVDQYPELQAIPSVKTGVPEHPLQMTVHHLKEGEDYDMVMRALGNADPVPPKVTDTPSMPEGVRYVDRKPDKRSMEILEELGDPEVDTILAAQAVRVFESSVDDLIQSAKIFQTAPHHLEPHGAGKQIAENLREKVAKARRDEAIWVDDHGEVAGHVDRTKFEQLQKRLEEVAPKANDLLKSFDEAADAVQGTVRSRGAPSLRSVRPITKDGSSVVNAPKKVTQFPAGESATPEGFGKYLDDIEDFLVRHVTVTPGGGAAKTRPMESAEAVKSFIKERIAQEGGAVGIGFDPKTKTIDIVTERGNLYQIEVQWHTSGSARERVNGTFNGFSSMEHYVDDLMSRAGTDPMVRMFRVLDSANKENFEELSGEINKIWKEAGQKGTLTADNLSDAKLIAENRINKWLKQFPVEHEPSDITTRMGGSKPAELGGKPFDEGADIQVHAFHGSEGGVLPGADVKLRAGGFHAGSKDAADQRLGALTLRTNKEGEMISVSMRLKRSIGTPENPVSEEKMLFYLRNAATRSEPKLSPEKALDKALDDAADEADLISKMTTEEQVNFKNQQRDDDLALGAEQLKKEGYDGIVYRNEVEEPGSVSAMAFDMANVKKRDKIAITLKPEEAGLSFKKKGGVYGAFVENQYSIGKIIDVDGRRGKIIEYGEEGGKTLEDAKKFDTRTVQFEDGTVAVLSDTQLRASDIMAASRRGESTVQWLLEMAKDEAGSVRLGLLDRLRRKVHKVAPDLQAEHSAELIDQAMKLDPQWVKVGMKARAQAIEMFRELHAAEKAAGVPASWLPYYAFRHKLEGSKGKWFDNKAQNLQYTQFNFQKHRTLEGFVEDYNQIAIANGRPDLVLGEDASISLGLRSIASAEAIAHHKVRNTIFKDFAIELKDLRPLETADRFAMAKKLGMSDEDLKRMRFIANRLKTRTGLDDPDKAIRIAEVRGESGFDRATQLEINQLAKEWKDLAPQLQVVMPMGSFRTFMADIAPKKAFSEVFSEEELGLDLFNVMKSMWNAKSGEEFVVVPSTAFRSIRALTTKGLPAYVMDESVRNMANRYLSDFNDYGRISGPMIKVIKNLNDLWTRWTLFPVPVYHIRNHITNVTLALQHGVDNPDVWNIAYDLQKGKRLNEVVFTDRWKKDWTGQEVLDAALAERAIDTGWSAADFDTAIRDKLGRKTSGRLSLALAAAGGGAGFAAVPDVPGIEGGQERAFGAATGFVLGGLLGSTMSIERIPRNARHIRKFSKKDGLIDKTIGSFRVKGPFLRDRNFIIWHTQQFGKHVENNTRLAVFIHKLKEGSSKRNSGYFTKKVLHDFGDLSNAEKKYFKTLFPFYTWTRKALPQQMRMLLTRPMKVVAVGKLKDHMDRIILPEPEGYVQTLMERWQHESLPMFTGINEDGTVQMWLMQNWIPQGELMRLNNPMSFLHGMLTPVIKTPLEVGLPLPTFITKKFGNIPNFNKNLFFDSPLEGSSEFYGYRWEARDVQLARISRLANMWNKMWFNDHLPAFRRAIEPMVGRSYTVDFIRSGDRRIWEIDKEIRKTKSDISKFQRLIRKRKANGESTRVDENLLEEKWHLFRYLQVRERFIKKTISDVRRAGVGFERERQ